MKTLYLDIETTPHKVDVWSLFNQNVSINQIHEPSMVLCFSAKWEFDKDYYFFDMRKREEMVDAAHWLLEEADVVVGYNHVPFDLPHLNREFLRHDYTPPAPYHSVDLLKTVRKRFNFASNKLAYVTTQLGLETKIQHSGHELWIRCIKGDEEAWVEMEEYSVRDTYILEPLHKVLLPWLVDAPNYRLYINYEGVENDRGCPRCGCMVYAKRGFSYSATGKFQRYKCTGCGGWFKDTKRVEGRGTVGA